MRLIDADKLDTRERGNNSQRTMWREIERLIKNAPTVDVPRWISVEERLPPAYIRVYAVIKGADDAIIAWVDDKGRWDDDDSWTYEKIVTHWMPLPELPEVKLCEND